jgi:hypothetical protein
MHVTTSTSDFINNTVHMLISGSIFVRESAKDALGNELPLTLSQTLVSSMMKYVKKHTVSREKCLYSQPASTLCRDQWS